MTTATFTPVRAMQPQRDTSTYDFSPPPTGCETIVLTLREAQSQGYTTGKSSRTPRPRSGLAA